MVEFQPAIYTVRTSILESIAETASHSKSGVVGRAASDPNNHALPRMLSGNLSEQLSQTARIQLEWMKLARGQHREANDFRALQHCGRMRIAPPPGGANCFMRRVKHLGGSLLGAEQPSEDLSKSIAAVAHRKQFELVGWPFLPPTAGDCLRRLLGGQRAFELIWDD